MQLHMKGLLHAIASNSQTLSETGSFPIGITFVSHAAFFGRASLVSTDDDDGHPNPFNHWAQRQGGEKPTSGCRFPSLPSLAVIFQQTFQTFCACVSLFFTLFLLPAAITHAHTNRR